MIRHSDPGEPAGRPVRRRIRAWTVGVGTAALVAGCGLVSPSENESPRKALQRNRALWTSLALNAYQYEESKSCECVAGFVGPVAIAVENGQMVAVARVQGGEPVEEELWPAFDSIEELFDLIAHALDQDAYVLEVAYDRVRGFPTRINLDLNAQTADDEVLIVVGELTPASSG